ncbi:MAG: hypothetical protein PHO83_11385 [Geobacteraceae bacterium]|nr:hypothetical protein [Geobacteraceae bacterium]
MIFLSAPSRLRANRISSLCRHVPVTVLAILLTWSAGLCEPGATEHNSECLVDEPYHTPLAGEAYTTTFLGRTINIPSRNRENIRSLTLGANFYAPDVGGDTALPIAALYFRHQWQNWWLRSVIGVFVNEVDVARNIGRFQLLGHFENNTVPFADTEVKDGKEVKTSSVTWGTVAGWLGAGIRIPVAPSQADNDLRLQLYYQGGYFYDKRTSDTGPNVVLPPDTFFQGLRFRARYDGLRRNIMELPHDGWAAGGDLEYTFRNKWSDSTFGSLVYAKDETREYLKLSGYLIGAAGIPWLSERHRFVGYLHGGVSPVGRLDRFSAFRAGGGPFPNETDDLYRLPYPGALFNDFPVSDYVVGTLEYRYELLFFMYLHLRATFAWGANRPDYATSEGVHLKLTSADGEAFSAGLTTGFFYDSQLYLEYAYDNKFLRNGTSGSSFMLLWSKEF